MSTKVKDDQLNESYIKSNGSRAFSSNQSMGNNRITNLGAPINDNDAVRKIDLVTGDQILISGSMTLDTLARTYTFADGWSWRINGNIYTPSEYTTSEIPEEAAGFSRAYIVVGKNDATFLVIAGDTTEDLPIDPPTPPGTIYLTRFVSSGDIIGEPEEPIIGSDDYRKIYLSEWRFTEEVLEITLPNQGQTNFVFTVGGFDIEGFIIPSGHEHLFPGKLFFLYNASDDPITLLFDEGTADILFNFKDAADLIIEPDTKVILQYSPLYGMQLVSGGSGASFDPNIDQIGTIAKVNAPVNSGMTVNEASGNFQGQIDGLQWKEMSVVGTVTAENYQNYTKYGGAATTFTDPTPVASGIGFTVRVVQGTAVIGGVSYGVGYIVNRLFLGSWQTRAYVDQTIIGSATQTALNLKENTSNKATSLGSPDHTKYPTTLAVSAAFDSLQGQIDALDLNIGDILTREMIENGIAWFLPALNGITSDARNSSRVNTNPVYFGTVSIGALQFSITAHSITGPGQVSGVRAHSGFSISTRNGVDTIRDFYPPALPASSDTRYTVGWSQQFNAADPTNTDQLTHINCMYVCKLATSDNLHIVHNDATGTATSIDLGTDFPANSALYKFRFFVRKITNSSYLVQVIRTTLSNGAILVSDAYSITANLPTAASDLNQIFYIASNTQTGTYLLGDYGLILKRTPL